MCGIAGIFHLDSPRAVDACGLKNMCEVLAHRGPDDEGRFLDDNIGLAHRRLSIIDLSIEGHQPMHNEDGTLWIVHNGEIYNYLELIKVLKNLGHVFRSNTDTEVIIHSFEEWGVSCLNKFNGMWAFAIWDKNKKTLFCSRDRFGVKPFYYFIDQNRFIFASEIKAIFENRDVPKMPNENAISRYLIKGYGYVDTSDETFFSGIKQLKASHYLTISKEKFEYKRYWGIDFRNKDHNPNADRLKEKFLFLLNDSVRLRLRSDVPLGISLSGGLDSSTLAVTMSRLLDRQIESFSACFDMPEYDERDYINEILIDRKIIPNFVYPEAKSLFNEFEHIIWHQDEPYSGASVFAQWKVMERAKEKGVKVLLTGQGGDETMAGYYKYYPYYLTDLFTAFRWPRLLKEFAALSYPNGFSKKDVLLSILKIIGSRYCPRAIKDNLHAKFVPRPSFLSQDFSRASSNFDNEYQYSFDSFTDNELYNSVIVSPLPSLLHIDDRNSMAHSVESRAPFLDYRLVEFLFSLPYDMKISDGYTKYILRESMKGSLPEKIRKRRDKMGFVTPARRWFEHDLKDNILEIFRSSSFEKRGIFDRKGVERVLALHFEGKADFSFTIWSWVNLELWFRKFIDRR